MNVRAMYSHVRAGGAESVVAEHAQLVKRIAFHLMNRLPDHIQAEDLIQAGMIGLLEAARLYDPVRAPHLRPMRVFGFVERCLTKLGAMIGRHALFTVATARSRQPFMKLRRTPVARQRIRRFAICWALPLTSIFRL
jgi:hypothetical protein